MAELGFKKPLYTNFFIRLFFGDKMAVGKICTGFLNPCIADAKSSK